MYCCGKISHSDECLQISVIVCKSIICRLRTQQHKPKTRRIIWCIFVISSLTWRSEHHHISSWTRSQTRWAQTNRLVNISFSDHCFWTLLTTSDPLLLSGFTLYLHTALYLRLQYSAFLVYISRIIVFIYCSI